MITRNYEGNRSGLLLASGPGSVTVTCIRPLDWAIGDSASLVPAVRFRHFLAARDVVSMTLEAGEYLWAWNDSLIAVTAANPAAGSV